VCLSVCCSHWWILQKWPKRSTRRLGTDSGRPPRKTCIRWGKYGRHLANTIEWPVLGGDAGCCSNYSINLFLVIDGGRFQTNMTSFWPHKVQNSRREHSRCRHTLCRTDSTVQDSRPEDSLYIQYTAHESNTRLQCRRGIEWSVASVTLCVCLSMRLCVRALKGKLLELSTPNLVYVYSMAGSWHAFIRRSKGRKSRSHGYKNRHGCTVTNGEWAPAAAVCCCCRRGTSRRMTA